MATLTFSVSSYKIEINQIASGGSSTIELSGSLGHSNVKATLQFFPENPYEGKDIGKASNIGSKAITLTIWFDSTTFAGFYQVLSSEKPVSMKIDYEHSIDAPKDPLFNISSASLLTSIETPGDYEKS